MMIYFRLKLAVKNTVQYVSHFFISILKFEKLKIRSEGGYITINLIKIKTHFYSSEEVVECVLLVIEGRIINLRTLEDSDAYSIYKNAKDRKVSRFTHLPYPYRLKYAQDFVRLCQEHYKNKTDYELGIEFKETGEIIGMISLMHLSNSDRSAEVGYWLGIQYWRRGITKEALSLILGFGFNNLELIKIYAKVLHPNFPSIRLLQSAGFGYEGRIKKSILREGSWLDELIFVLVDKDFRDNC
jgi:RimJ/RimL family protein N-acetyltransferase